MRQVFLPLFCVLLLSASVSAVEFEKFQLADKFYAEGAAYADFNKDGVTDVYYGPYVYLGPDFKKTMEVYEVKDFPTSGYSENFVAFTDDFNKDGWPDVLVCPHPGKDGFWLENPQNKEGHWKAHFYSIEVGNESQVYVDVDGDGQRDLVFNRIGFLGFASPDPADPYAPWKWTAVSEKNDRYQRYCHGIGAGDVNNDGRCDLIDSKGWYENPGKGHEGAWTFHAFDFASRGGSTILVYDVDGDGLSDVVTADSAHLFGLQWWKQVKGADGGITFEKNVLISPEPKEGEIRVSQLHSFDYGDINGDGLIDFVTGKRFHAHGPQGDVEPNAPAVLYWFELKRENGKATFLPHLIDDNSGVGTQITVGDVNGDGKLDVLSGNKKGCHLFLQK
ncbi:MAG: VCBS repeat-containing protein [Planctomycetia bacterium]|nr:VCBS repeat-containing protein [Planctomycetia bacterium]